MTARIGFPVYDRDGVYMGHISTKAWQRLVEAKATGRSAIADEPLEADEDLVPQLLSVTQVAAALGVSDMTVRRLIANKRLNSVRVGQRLRVDANELRLFLLRAAERKWEKKEVLA